MIAEGKSCVRRAQERPDRACNLEQVRGPWPLVFRRSHDAVLSATKMLLDVFKDGELIESIQLSASKRLYTVGRQPNVSDIFLSHASISREQATLTVSASGTVVVMDAGSAQGTFISGKKLPPKKKHTLPPGRSLVFGKSTRVYKLREGGSGFMNDAEAVPAPKQQKRYNETLATALLSVLRRGSLDDSERLRPDGYVPLAALLASSALASFR